MFDTWISLSADEIVYHLKTSLEGTDSSMVADYFLLYGSKWIVVITIATLALVLAREQKVLYRALCMLFAVTSISASCYALIDLERQTGLITYLRNGGDGPSSFIEENYVDAGSVEIQFPEQKRNVIYLMVESMEITYANTASGGAFEQNVIPELTTLAQEGEDFSGSSNKLNGALSLPGSTWTMGAMFSLTSGLPLKIPLQGNQMQSAESFFPTITTMGDILAKEGYTQELLIGSDASFGGRELYFTQHGNFAINDYNSALAQGFIPEGYKVFWGYEDAKLFDMAKQRLTELAANDEPFNLTMLTVDTHFEDGYVCDSCNSSFGDDQYANVMACSSAQLAEFIEWVQAQPFYENTTIVICGDHPTMDADFCEEAPDDYLRRVITSIINGVAQPENPNVARLYSTLDLFPTVLVAMGATIPGDQLGLGVNLYGSTPTIVERYGLEKCENELAQQSEFMNELSQVTITDDIVEKLTASAQLSAYVGPELDPPLKDASEGAVSFVLSGHCYVVNSESIAYVELAITDTRTGKTETHLMNLHQSDPNYFEHYLATPYTEEDLPYLEATATLSLKNIEEHPVVKLSP